MERDLTIRYKNNYFGNLTFFYENYFRGSILAQRKELKEMTIDSVTKIDLVEIYSKYEKFDHKKVALSDLSTLDRTYIFSLFEKEINDNGLDRREFTLNYSDYLPFYKLLYNEDYHLIGNITIDINSDKQTKEFFFKPFHPNLKELLQRNIEPFAKINNQILFEFWNKQIKGFFPNSFYR